MFKVTLKVRLLIFIGLITLILIFIGLVIILPTIKSISSLKKEIGTIETDLEQRYQNSQKLKRTLRELNDIKLEIGKFNSVSIFEGDELKIITELENLAAKYQVDQILNVSLQTVPKTELGKFPTPKYYSFSFLNTGSFSNLISYLNDLEKLPYYINIRDIRFEKKQKNKEEILITLSFNGLVYVKPETAQK